MAQTPELCRLRRRTHPCPGAVRKSCLKNLHRKRLDWFRPEKAMAAGVDSTSRVCVDHVLSPGSKSSASRSYYGGLRKWHRGTRAQGVRPRYFATSHRCPMPIAITARSHRRESQKKSKYNSARVGLGLSHRKQMCRSALCVLIFIFLSRWESGRDGDLNYMCNEVGNSLSNHAALSFK